MKVNLYLAIIQRQSMSLDVIKGEKLATVNLEVVPSGTYVIDGKEYTLVGKPTFHIATTLSTAHLLPSLREHTLESVDLMVTPPPTSRGV